MRTADAHVKWFCAYDVAGQPRGLENVLCQDFELLLGIALFWLLMGCLVERSFIGDAMTRALNAATHRIMLNTELIVRAVCGFFLISIWATGGIILTPELKTTSTIVPTIQLLTAAGLLWRRTMPLSALGIVVLFGIAVHDYGAFHLADYPIFLGVAAYLALTGLQKDLFGVRPLDVVRIATGITLMWASIEKWAYPEWSFPIFIEHPALTFGFSAEFYMRAAGMVEFVLAFALIWTPLVRRVAAIILAGMFISACFEFGKLDTIGHSAIIAVLFAIMADDRVQVGDRRHPILAPLSMSAALVATLLVYYVGHAALFSTAVL
ncbi:hypothetical protein [Bradyrhizobium sp. 2TAF24]|uniref:hypothetical protein n=1 Tax=Bradyrhizobium sp. 2TAF24 TaxID=3233011 RepID=UPI003F8FB6C7